MWVAPNPLKSIILNFKYVTVEILNDFKYSIFNFEMLRNLTQMTHFIIKKNFYCPQECITNVIYHICNNSWVEQKLRENKKLKKIYRIPTNQIFLPPHGYLVYKEFYLKIQIWSKTKIYKIAYKKKNVKSGKQETKFHN